MQVAHPLKLLMTQIISKWNYYAILIEVELISSSVVLGLDAQKHDSVIYTYISVSSDSFPHRSSSNIEPFILNTCAVQKVLVFYFISVCSYLLIFGFPGGSALRMQKLVETHVQYLEQDSLEEGKATPSSGLAWRRPWTEEPGGLQSMGSPRVGQNWSHLAHRHTSINPKLLIYSSPTIPLW